MEFATLQDHLHLVPSNVIRSQDSDWSCDKWQGNHWSGIPKQLQSFQPLFQEAVIIDKLGGLREVLRQHLQKSGTFSSEESEKTYFSVVMHKSKIYRISNNKYKWLVVQYASLTCNSMQSQHTPRSIPYSVTRWSLIVPHAMLSWMLQIYFQYLIQFSLDE